MNSRPSILLVIFILIGFVSSSQNQVIMLNLEEGHEYFFEKTDRIYGLREDKSKDVKSVHERIIRIVVDKIIPEESILFTLTYKKNLEDQSLNAAILNRTDFFFPDLNPGGIAFSESRLIELLACRSSFRFSIDLKTNEMVLLNRSELLEQFYAQLDELMFDQAQIKESIDSINSRKYLIAEDQVSFLIWFNNAELEPNQTLTNTQLQDKFIVRELKGEFLNFGDHELKKIIGHKTYRKFWLNLENGIITNYSTIQYDSVKSRIERAFKKVEWVVNETGFRLLYSRRVPDNNLIISGKIENPLSNKIHIKFLDEPFGEHMKNKTVLLDENGAFSTDLAFHHSGLVYVENENRNKHNPPGTYVFYAEPGDSIHFVSTGSRLPWNTIVSGNRTEEQRLLQELRREIRILDLEGSIGGWSNEILDRQISISSYPSKDMSGDAIFEILFNSLRDAEAIIAEYRPQLSERSFQFISNEIQSYFYDGIYRFALYTLIVDLIPYDQYVFENKATWKAKVDSINVHRFYNDFGLYSRKCVSEYLRYHSTAIPKVRYRYSTGVMQYRVSPAPEMGIQLARMMLTGSPLYRKVAANLVSLLETAPETSYTMQTCESFPNDLALEYLDLITLRSNDQELNKKVNQVVLQHQKLETGKFIPQLGLLNINQLEFEISDFLGTKPTIFYFSQNWINDRYEYDDMAKSMPEFNFIMVVEGSNFKQWQEYTNAAAPAMTHLFYLNDTLAFRDIFQAPDVHMVFNKEGEYIGNAENPKQAARMAKQSLEPKKKEINKSQLISVVLILNGIILLLIVIMLFWKWRVRKRFRKEAQIRKLRELELIAIRSQMNPHFLFNCLNSVQNLVQQNRGREAHLYLSDFAGLIRKVLKNAEKEEVSLAEELEMNKQYLTLEKLRFDFDFDIVVDREIDLNNTLVPSMLLQPFVENAVIHGLQNKQGARKLIIDVKRLTGKDKGIAISIEDNGIGREAAKAIQKVKNGKGVKLIRERLEILQKKQGERYSLNTIDLEEGTRVEIIIPEEN